MKILKFNKYSFLYDNFEHLKESNSEFNQYQFGLDPFPLGPGYGFAVDPQLSIYSDDSSPYRDNYARTSQTINDIGRVMRNLQGQIITTFRRNYFIDDIDDYENMKILRIFTNSSMKIDVYFSFDFKGEEFFAVFNNFNGLEKPPKMKSELFSDNRYRYIDREYYLKLNNYLYKIIYNWFIPNRGLYLNMKDIVNLKGDMGETIEFKEGKSLEVIGYNVDKDNDPYIIVRYENETYKIIKNNYYFFKYWFESI